MNDPEMMTRQLSLHGYGPVDETTARQDPHVDEIACDECNAPVGFNLDSEDKAPFIQYWIEKPAQQIIAVCDDCMEVVT